MNWLAVILIAALASPATEARADGVDEREHELGLEEVLDSTRRHYPPLVAAIQRIDAARGDVLDANGKFDTALRIGAAADRFGFYENERFDVGGEQPLQWWGAKLYAGWRIGQGRFAPYNGLQETRDGGEVSAGIKLPLLRDRSIDPNRASLRKNAIGVGIAELTVEEQQLLIRQLASTAYWDWVAAGRALAVAQAVLDVALARDAFLRENVAAGALAAVEVTDNRRAILSRRSSVISAEQKLRKTAIYLSLYYRDAQGNPAVASESRVPDQFPVPRALDFERVDEDVALALERRPELRLVRAETDRVQVDESVAINAREPALDLSLGVTAEAGTNPDVKRGPSELKAGLVWTFPIQQRSANGKLLKARAKLLELRQKERFAIEKIEVEVREAALAVDASYRRIELANEEVEVARELESLERERFDLGDSNLFTVNLREETTASAELRRLTALADHHRSRALYQFVTAEP